MSEKFPFCEDSVGLVINHLNYISLYFCHRDDVDIVYIDKKSYLRCKYPCIREEIIAPVVPSCKTKSRVIKSFSELNFCEYFDLSNDNIKIREALYYPDWLSKDIEIARKEQRELTDKADRERDEELKEVLRQKKEKSLFRKIAKLFNKIRRKYVFQ